MRDTCSQKGQLFKSTADSLTAQQVGAYQWKVLELRQLICIGPSLEIDSSGCATCAEQQHKQIMGSRCHDFICKLSSDSSWSLLNRDCDCPCAFQAPARQQQ